MIGNEPTPKPFCSSKIALSPSMSATPFASANGVIGSALFPITRMGLLRVAFHGPENLSTARVGQM